METRSGRDTSQLKVYLEKDGSVHKEIGAVVTESLVFEGGGMRGISYIGATKALFEAGIMHTVKRVAGTSAGAITAYIIALGYQQEDIERLLRNSDMADLLETKNLFSAAKISKLIKYGYFNEGDKLLEKGRQVGKERVIELMTQYQLEHANNPVMLAHLDNLHININRITFQNYRHLSRIIPEAGIKDIFIIAAKLPSNSDDICGIKIFSAQHTPHDEVALAVRASISIPKLFKPVELDGNKYVDGGCISNFPIDVFNGIDFRPDDTYMFQGNNSQNFSTLGIKIDTEDEVRDLLHAPVRSRSLKTKVKDKMVDRISGLPISHSYKMNHLSVRDHYSHRSCQLNDEGVKTTQFNLSEESAEQLIKRGYDDMALWIENYHDSAMESRKFSSFGVMCENMSLDELGIFCGEMMMRPQDIMRISGRCGFLVPIDDIHQFQKTARKIFKEKKAAHEIIRECLPELNAVLRKYDTDFVTIYSRLDNQHEVSDVKMWVKAAAKAVQIILGSQKNNFIKKDDVMRVTKFLEEVKGCSAATKPRGMGLFHVSKKMSKFSLPENVDRLGRGSG